MAILSRHHEATEQLSNADVRATLHALRAAGVSVRRIAADLRVDRATVMSAIIGSAREGTYALLRERLAPRCGK